MFDFFDFDPLDVGNSMTLGMLEENGYSNFVNGVDDDNDEIIYVMEVDEDDEYEW